MQKTAQSTNTDSNNNKQRQCKKGYTYPKVLFFKVLTNVQQGTLVENPKLKFHESICMYANDQMIKCVF